MINTDTCIKKPLDLELFYKNMRPVTSPVYLEDIVDMQKHCGWIILTDKKGMSYYADINEGSRL